jgi:hypothetical protein
VSKVALSAKRATTSLHVATKLRLVKSTTRAQFLLAVCEIAIDIVANTRIDEDLTELGATKIWLFAQLALLMRELTLSALCALANAKKLAHLGLVELGTVLGLCRSVGCNHHYRKRKIVYLTRTKRC